MDASRSNLLARLRSETDRSRFALRVSEEGTVFSVGDEILEISGLRNAKLYELIELEGGDYGIVFDIGYDRIGVVLLTEKNGPRAGEKAYKTERIAAVPVGDALLGRVVNALGTPLDGGPVPEGTVPCPVERPAPPMTRRDFVTEPLYTGIKLLDAMLPIGRGQRELIIGDPSTGKTSIGVDMIVNQKNSDVLCLYVAIGQKKSHIARVIEEIREHGDFSRTIVVAADASDSLGLQYIAPYSGTAIAEYFLDRGRDVLVVYDDLTKHAEAYRSLSLLLKRPPGREAYPGDIFYIHSRLLERSAKLGERYGGGSITAIPIVETQQGRIASYIPTNLISITDGQIYLDTTLYNKGIRPAVDVGRSVSRIGGKAQADAMKVVAERLKIDYSRFIEAEVFTRFGAHVEEETARLLRRGERLRELMIQQRFHPFSLEETVVSMLVLESGILDTVELDRVKERCREILERAMREFPEIMERLRDVGRLEKLDLETIRAHIARENGQ